ncbi:hypothetical protein HYR99_23270 [Candidatus Poribacteria bacterium]|nr:hypothetical protein [Candidatus Poribacteria bacterium]
MAEIPSDVLKVLEVRHGQAEELEEAREFCLSFVNREDPLALNKANG